MDSHHVKLTDSIPASFAPFTSLTCNDISPEAPQLNLEISARSTISTTLPYDIKFTVQRLADSPANPCIFRWPPSIYGLMRARFILLHDTVDGLNQIDVEQMRLPDRSGEEDEIVLDAKDHERLRELSSGAEMVWKSRLTSNYHMLLVPGEKYHLVWPGMEITMWDWGTFQGHVGQKMKSQRSRNGELPKLVLPACGPLTFVARQEEEPWPDRASYLAHPAMSFESANIEESMWWTEEAFRRAIERAVSPPPITASERVSGAPIINVTIEGPSQVGIEDKIEMTIKVTYTGVKGAAEESRPITFRERALQGQFSSPSEGCKLYRLRDGRRQQVDDDDDQGYKLVGDEPIDCKVGSSDYFRSLGVGESWTQQLFLSEPRGNMMKYNKVVGDRFAFMYKGGRVEWWDFGNKEEHSLTVVTLSDFGDLICPIDNDGRPALIVPASEAAEFMLHE